MISRRYFLATTGVALLMPRLLWSKEAVPKVPPMLDHILLGCSDLGQGIAFVEQRTGVRPAIGGVHPGRGTRNALLSLGERHYLEVIAPDPGQSRAEGSRASMVNELKQLTSPRIVDWAVHTTDIEAVAERLRKAGIAFEGPSPGSRKRPDGRVLNWQTLNLEEDRNGLLPFFIQWGAGSAHPSVDAPSGCRLDRFAACSRNHSELAALFQRLGIEVGVERTERDQLRAQITGPRGNLDLRS